MARFTVSICVSDDVFGPAAPGEVARILEALILRLRLRGMSEQVLILRDAHGMPVGYAKADDD